MESYCLKKGEKVYVVGPSEVINGCICPPSYFLLQNGADKEEDKINVHPFNIVERIKNALGLPVDNEKALTYKFVTIYPEELQKDIPLIRMWNKNSLDDGYTIRFAALDEEQNVEGGIALSIYPYDDIRYAKQENFISSEEGIFYSMLDKESFLNSRLLPVDQKTDPTVYACVNAEEADDQMYYMY